MFPVTLGLRETGPLHVLCLGAHGDDIEVGAGGTILKLLANRSDLNVTWVVLSGDEIRAGEATASARRFLAGAAAQSTRVEGFRDGYFPFDGAAVKDYFETLKRDLSPDLIFTHHRNDRHQDHRLVSDLTWNTFRDHLVLEYEVPKYDGDLGQPNLYVPLEESCCREKVRILRESFVSQRDRHWFAEETFMGLMRLRGIECRSPVHYAEAFHARKLVLGNRAVP